MWWIPPEPEAKKLIAPSTRHCPTCEVAWRWEPACWSCGGQGVVGDLPFVNRPA